MDFFILLGFLSFIIMIIVKNRLFSEEDIDYNSNNVEAQIKSAKQNKFFWNFFFWGGLILMIVGIIGTILI